MENIIIESSSCKTSHLLLKNKSELIQEIKEQGLSRFISHLEWTDYIYFTCKELPDKVLEMEKRGSCYKKRNLEYSFVEIEEDDAIGIIVSAISKLLKGEKNGVI